MKLETKKRVEHAQLVTTVTIEIPAAKRITSVKFTYVLCHSLSLSASLCFLLVEEAAETAETKRCLQVANGNRSVVFLVVLATSPLVSGLVEHSAYLYKNIIQRCDHTLKVNVCVQQTQSLFSFSLHLNRYACICTQTHSDSTLYHSRFNRRVRQSWKCH